MAVQETGLMQPRIPVFVVSALLLIHGLLVGVQAARWSPTLDEVGHLPAGISVWKFGRTDLYRVNPPLVKSIAALPAVLAGAETDWTRYRESTFGRPEFSVGEDFVAANGDHWFRWFQYARWAVLPLSLLGGLVCYCWGRELYGAPAGLVACCLWCFSPNVLTWSSTINPDLGATSLGLLAGWLFWKWLKEPTLGRSLAAGIALGLAELAKMTLVIFFVVWPILWVVWKCMRTNRNSGQDADCNQLQESRSEKTAYDNTVVTSPGRQTFGNRWERIWRELGELTGILLLGLYVLNLGYGFAGSFQRLGDYTFGSRMLAGEKNVIEREGGAGGNRFAGTWVGSLPVPFPTDYLAGMDRQRMDFEWKLLSYLNGQWKRGGWWYYYFVAAGLKEPLGTWMIMLMSVGLTLFCRPYRTRWRDEVVLLVPAVTILVLVSSQTGMGRYLRYILPALPFLFIWCGKVACSIRTRQWSIAAVAVLALGWTVASSLSVFPHSLSYFNELAGGASGGHRYLLDANIDWGQDLWYFKDWYDAHPEARPMEISL